MDDPRVVSRDEWLAARSELLAQEKGWTGEMHGLSAFLRRGDRVFHTYSSYARAPTWSTAPTSGST